jgi:lipopolysaccharide/colanic/teichoic acid biosynthesis glycosyltransferase
MDVSISLVLGVISLAVYPFVYLAIKLDDGGTVFFKQDRIGRGGRVIKIIKFRTMSEGVHPQVTRVGDMLRKIRIDELPQLWNILRGDISLVGPRPELPDLVKLYEKEIPYYSVRHLLKPGLSGWAQIHQEKPPKFDVGYDETKTKLSYDLYYIKNRSFMLDLKIALQTIKTILSRSGI